MVRVVVPGPGDRLCLGPLEVDLGVASASVAGTAVRLSPSELGLLALLVANPHRVLARGFLAEQLGLACDRSIDVMLVRLRGALGSRSIRTVRGRGWVIEPQTLAAAGAPYPGPGAVAPPQVPEALRVPPGHEVFLHARARGTLRYRWAHTHWAEEGPDARLSDPRGVPIIRHFTSPGPSGAPCVAWRHADGSAVWGTPLTEWSAPPHVAPGATPWRLFRADPDGEGLLGDTAFIQRLLTRGGLPAAGAGPVGDGRVEAAYSAEIFFWRRHAS